VYPIAVLFLLWALINLIGGDYLELVIGVTVASMLGAGQYFWDALGGDGFWHRIKVPLAVGVMLAGLGVVATLLLEEVEAGAEDYLWLEQAATDFPGLRAEAAEALADRKLSVVEAYALEQAYLDLARERAIERLGRP
jgi:hypothetical protein